MSLPPRPRRNVPVIVPSAPKAPEMVTEPAPATLADILAEVRRGFANCELQFGAINTKLAALEGGVRMAIAGDTTTHGKLEELKGRLDALNQLVTGLRSAEGSLFDRDDSMRGRIVRLEERMARVDPEGEHVNGAANGSGG